MLNQNYKVPLVRCRYDICVHNIIFKYKHTEIRFIRSLYINRNIKIHASIYKMFETNIPNQNFRITLSSLAAFINVLGCIYPSIFN